MLEMKPKNWIFLLFRCECRTNFLHKSDWSLDGTLCSLEDVYESVNPRKIVRQFCCVTKSCSYWFFHHLQNSWQLGLRIVWEH